MPRTLGIDVVVSIVCLKLANYSTVEICAALDISDYAVKTYGGGLRKSTPENRGRRKRSPAEQQRMLLAWQSQANRELVARRFGYKTAASMRQAIGRIKKRKL